MKFKTVLSLACVSLFGAALASGGFIQCPAVGSDTAGCELLVTINTVNGLGVATGFTVTTASPDQGPFDGVEDTLIGIQNASGGVFKSISFTNVFNGTTGAFNFSDGDGACTNLNTAVPGSCVGGDSSGYGGPGITYSGISGTIMQNGTVNFLNGGAGLANGGHAWFSLEERISATVLTSGAPEPGSVVLMGAGLAGLFLFARRRLTAR